MTTPDILDDDGLRRYCESMLRFAKRINEIVIPAIDAFAVLIRSIDWEAKLSPDQREGAFRRYAARYSALHPPRSLSWRRLNRDQRQLAAFYWIGGEVNSNPHYL